MGIGAPRRCRVEHAWARARRFSRRFKPPVSSRPSWPRRPWACRSWWSSAGQGVCWTGGVLTRDSFGWRSGARQRRVGLSAVGGKCMLCFCSDRACPLRSMAQRGRLSFGRLLASVLLALANCRRLIFDTRPPVLTKPVLCFTAQDACTRGDSTSTEARRDEGTQATRRISYVVRGGDEGRGGTHYAQSSFFRLYALNWFVR